MKPYKVIVLPDTQIPFHDVKALAAVEKYMADETWGEWVQLGDFMDFHQLARFNENSPEALTRSLKGDYDVANEILDRHQSIIRKRNPKAKFTLLCGNHEDRVRKFAERFPQTKGIIDVESNLRLKEGGIKFVRCYPDGEIYKLGKAYFTHGLYTSTAHAKKHVDSFGVNIFYGHTHQTQSFSKVVWGKNRTIIGESLGCLCRYDLDYVGMNPTAWQHAVSVFYFRPDGYFNHFVIRIFNGSFIAPNGKSYG
jgi:predicted phosphodiesterase